MASLGIQRMDDATAARLMGALAEAVQCRRCTNGCVKAINKEARICCGDQPIDKLPMGTACTTFARANAEVLAKRGISA